MTELKTEHEVVLTSLVKYSHAGESLEATSVLLIAPSANQLKNTVSLKQYFFQAITSMDDGKEGDDKAKAKAKDIEMDGGAVMSMMYMSKIDMNDLFDDAKKLLTSGVAKLDGKEPLTDALIEKISVNDYEKIVGEYLVNFILASALDMMKSLDL